MSKFQRPEEWPARVNARGRRVTIGGRTMSERPVGDGYQYQVFFRRD